MYPTNPARVVTTMFVSTLCWQAGTSFRPAVSLPRFMLEM